jgi:hypothetical protein
MKPMRGNVTDSSNGTKDLPGCSRHSGMLLAGIQARATASFSYGWIPARRLPE